MRNFTFPDFYFIYIYILIRFFYSFFSEIAIDEEEVDRELELAAAWGKSLKTEEILIVDIINIAEQ